MKTCLLIILTIILLTSIAHAKSEKARYADVEIPDRVADCVSRLRIETSGIYKRALSHSRLSPEEISKWKKNIKWTALLPRLQFNYERNVLDTVELEMDDSVSVTSSGVNVGPTSSNWGRNNDMHNNIEVKAVWYLDELLFNRDSLSISSEARSQAAFRRELLDEIVKSVLELKRLLAIKLMHKNRKKGQLIFEIEEIVSRLDLFTGGWFGRYFDWRGVRCEGL